MDPIANFLTSIRNASRKGLEKADVPHSKMKISISKILKEEGFIEGFEEVEGEKPHEKILRVRLKYVGERKTRRPVISGLERVSRPGCRVYTKKEEIPWILSGLGVAIMSTSKGVMTGQRARQIGVGGEVLCKVW